MKKLFLIIPAVVLGMGAATSGVLASGATTDKANIKINYSSTLSKNSAQTDQKLNSSNVSFQTNAPKCFIDSNNDGICDNYSDGVCPRNVAVSGNYCGNGNCVDSNGDGICDTCGNKVYRRNGSGYGYHCGNGSGSGHHRGNGCGHRR